MMLSETLGSMARTFSVILHIGIHCPAIAPHQHPPPCKDDTAPCTDFEGVYDVLHAKMVFCIASWHGSHVPMSVPRPSQRQLTAAAALAQTMTPRTCLGSFETQTLCCGHR